MKFHSINDNIKILSGFLLLFVTVSIYAQPSNLLRNSSFKDPGNSEAAALLARQTAYLKTLYSNKVEAPKEIINGKEYESYYLISEVKPLLFPEQERTASVITPTRRYNNLTLQYDTFLDEAIYMDVKRTVNFRFPQIALNKDILDGFNLYFRDDSMIFRHFRLADCTGKNLREGFYEVAYEGKSRFIIKHESICYIRQGVDYYKYSPKNYVSTGGEYHKLKTKKDFLLIFGDKSQQVKAFLHSSGIRMRNADKAQIIGILKYYDSLN